MDNKHWYKNSYRRHLLDMHISDWDEMFLSKFDENEYIKCLKEANIKSPMIYLQAHTGLCNWNSKTAKTHKAFLSNNKIKKLIDMCHDNGMDVIAYYSVVYNNWVYDNYPQWRMVDANGNPSRTVGQKTFESSDRYGIICPNNKNYREFLVKQFNELCEEYEFEGIFLDMTFWPTICFCDTCKQRYKEQTGLDIPIITDWQDENWMKFQEYREKWIGEFAQFCTDELKKLKKDITVEHQFAHVSYDWKFAVTHRNSLASDYSGGDMYGGFHQQSFVCKLYYEITQNQPFEYMTSRCDPDLHDHTTTKSLEQLKMHNYLTLAHHGAFLIIDAINLDGTMKFNVYTQIGKMFKESKAYEEFLLGNLNAKVAVLFNLESKYDKLAEPLKCTEADKTNLHLEACLGASRALSENNILYTVIPNSKIDGIQDKKVIILSEMPAISDDEIDEIVKFVDEGGNIYISGTTNFKLVNRLLNLKLNGITKENITYIAPTVEGKDLFGEMYTEDNPIAYKRKQYLCECNEDCDVLATITLPCTDPMEYGKFGSIHSNPPAYKTNYPSIIRKSYGQGKVIWSGAAFEKNPQKAHRDVFVSLIKQLYDDNMQIISDAPNFVEFTLFSDEDHDLLHCINVQDNTYMMKPCKFDVSVKVEKEVKSLKLLPNMDDMPYTVENGYITFTVENLDIFNMYKIDY